MKTRLPVLLLLALSFLLLFSAAEASTLTLPSGMTSIGSQAFMDDTSLDQVVLPEGLKKIYAKAFANSTVKKINLPSSLISIADDVFEGCENVYVTAKKGTYAYNWAVNRFYLPQISAGPDHTTIGEGQNCYLSISATGADLTYMWQYSTDSGATWSDATMLPGAGGDTAFIGEVSRGWNGYRFRCTVKDRYGHKLTSSVAKLTVVAKPKITSQPSDVTVDEGKSYSISLSATGTSLGYQWQYSTDNGSTWNNTYLTGYDTDTLHDPDAYLSWNGRRFRCIVTDSCGNSVTSASVLLTVVEVPKITSQPSNVTVGEGKPYSLTVSASGTDLSYQWQYSTDNGSTWTNSGLNGNKTNTLNDPDAYLSWSGRLFRCVVKNGYGKTVYSSTAKLTVIAKPAITVQPKNTVTTNGGSCSFSVTAKGTSLSYHWQWSEDSGTSWNDIDSTSRTIKYSNTSISWNGYLFRCTVSDSYGNSVTSESAYLTVVNAPKITVQPGSQKVNAGTSVSFSVTATGTGLTYQWQGSSDGGVTWTDSILSTANNRTLTFNAVKSMAGNHYRCIVKDKYGFTDTSAEAVLTIQTETVYRALLIGETSFYKYNKSTQKYYNENATRNSVDVSIMRTMLQSAAGPGGGSYSVTTRTNAGFATIRSLISSTFANTTENDVSLIMISTHGDATATDSSGHITARHNGDLWMPFLGTEDEMNVRDNRANYRWKDSDGVERDHTEWLSFSTLVSWLNTYVKGEVIVLIESCGAGAAIWETDLEQNGTGSEAISDSGVAAAWINRAISAFSAGDPGLSPDEGEWEANTGEMRVLNKYYVLAAARYGENSYGNNSTGNLFIRELVAGVGSKGNIPADSNSNGTVDLAELYNYIRQSDGQGGDGKYNDWYGENVQHVQRYPASGTGSTYPLFTFR